MRRFLGSTAAAIKVFLFPEITSVAAAKSHVDVDVQKESPVNINKESFTNADEEGLCFNAEEELSVGIDKESSFDEDKMRLGKDPWAITYELDQKTPMHKLSDEILLEILRHLHPESMYTVRQSCRLFMRLFEGHESTICEWSTAVLCLLFLTKMAYQEGI
ncbi:hypothetical protein PT974_05742 [Cladobotryum mycophilum]|uniref:F-box domain-containing protein n=1 Tax=Cladobotryum mycophilum TaxID=491253 RepID=A0ABR0SJK7_9HYPO